KFALATTSALTLLVVALSTGGPAAALRAVGVDAAIAAATAPIDAQAGGDHATAPAPGPVDISIDSDSMLLTPRVLRGSVPLTCGPVVTRFGAFATATVGITQGDGPAFATIRPVCDGTAHTFQATARAFGVPFQPGPATARASAFASGLDPMTFRLVFQTGRT